MIEASAIRDGDDYEDDEQGEPILPVILCGGSGTRLWPLSRKSFPKQFVPLIGDKSLLQLTLERVAPIAADVCCVASEEHRFLVADTLERAKTRGTVILEPLARNTAAAMAIAALHAEAAGQSDRLLLFCPADHHIPDADAFAAMVEQGRPAAEAGAIVVFGVVPSFPSTAYGYLRQGAQRRDGSWSVNSFVEKPNEQGARALVLGGDALWNAGIFLMQAETLLAALERHASDILEACEQAMTLAATDHVQATKRSCIFVRPNREAFETCRAQSIDYAVMEHYNNIAVVAFQGQWSDVGSWTAVADLATPDADENRIFGQGVTVNARNTYVHAPHRPVAVLGARDLIVVDTPDAVLIAHRDAVEDVREVVALLERSESVQAVEHRLNHRPWGWYDSIDRGPRFQVKRLMVKPGCTLSLQKHHHRAEHWVVVTGTAEVTVGDKTVMLTENQSTYIPLGELHRLSNPGSIPLEIIEVQSGSYLGEDDIVRFEDNYGRN